MQIGIILQYDYDGDTWFHIHAGIWCGLVFIVTGSLTLCGDLTFRKVMLIISIIFAIFLAFWAFVLALIHAGVDAWNKEYSHDRWLRVTQGFVGVIEIVLAIVTLCQRNTDSAGQVIATPQQLIILQQPGQPVGLTTTGQQVVTYQQPQAYPQPQPVVTYQQPQAYPQPQPVGIYNQHSAPPPYPV